MPTPDLAFKALADPARLRILEHLARPEATCRSPQDEVCACELEPLTGLAQPTISHHMRLLAEAGLVQARKQGRWVFYRLDRERLHALAGWLTALAGEPVTLVPPATIQPVRHPQ